MIIYVAYFFTGCQVSSFLWQFCRSSSRDRTRKGWKRKVKVNKISKRTGKKEINFLLSCTSTRQLNRQAVNARLTSTTVKVTNGFSSKSAAELDFSILAPQPIKMIYSKLISLRTIYIVSRLGVYSPLC